MIQRLEDSLEDMGPLFGLAQVESRATNHDRLAVVEKVIQKRSQIENLGLVLDDGQQDDSEGGLHLGHLVELVQDDLRNLPPLDLEHDPNAVAIRFVP